ncbi:hypothetical protein HKD37_13G036493 [Glycine soja]
MAAIRTYLSKFVVNRDLKRVKNHINDVMIDQRKSYPFSKFKQLNPREYQSSPSNLFPVRTKTSGRIQGCCFYILNGIN